MEGNIVENKCTNLELVPINLLKHHKKNARIGNVEFLKHSLLTHGAYKPLVVQKGTNVVLTGNHTLKAMRELGVAEAMVNYLEADDVEALAILLDDNKSSDDSSYNLSLLAESLSYMSNLGELARTGYDEQDLERIISEATNLDGNEKSDQEPQAENKYTRKIEAPVYEPSGEKPEISELYSRERADSLLAEIKEADIPFEVRKFLIEASSRFIEFNYGKIADFYAHSEKDVQDLMEKLALVIIDFNKALELGFVKLSEEIAQLYKEDYPEEAS